MHFVDGFLIGSQSRGQNGTRTKDLADKILTCSKKVINILCVTGTIYCYTAVLNFYFNSKLKKCEICALI